MEALFAGKKLKSNLLASRKMGYAVWLMNDKQNILTGKKYRQLWVWVQAQFIKNNLTELKGTVANQGKAKGKVRVILHTSKNINKQIAKFKEGEILVTEMTRPGTIMA